MAPARSLALGTRGSPLALAQAEAVAAALRQAHPELQVELRVIATEGDRVRDAALPSWGQGVFVREIEQALLDGRIDLAVHSLKDVPAELPDGLVLAAVPPRAAAGDVLVTAGGGGLDDLPAGARVGASGVRRAAFLRAYRPDLRLAPIRGNVDTRWRKLLDPAQGYDALVLAAAGLERLGLDGVPRAAIPPAVLLPAPGQGALALQARAADYATRALAAAADDAPTHAAVTAERRALRDLEGGCRLPVAALGELAGAGQLRLDVAVAAPDGSRVIRHAATGDLDAPERLGAAVAQALLAQGAAELLRQATAAAAGTAGAVPESAGGGR